MDGFNTSFRLGWPIFRCYVSFRESNDPWTNHFLISHVCRHSEAPLSDKAWLLGARVRKEACDDGIGVFHGEAFPNTRSYILENIAKYHFCYATGLLVLGVKNDGHQHQQLVFQVKVRGFGTKTMGSISLITKADVSPRLVQKITNQLIWHLVMQIPHLDLVFSFPQEKAIFCQRVFLGQVPQLILSICDSHQLRWIKNLHLFVPSPSLFGNRIHESQKSAHPRSWMILLPLFRFSNLLRSFFDMRGWCEILLGLRQMWATFPEMDSNWLLGQNGGHTPWFLLGGC